MSSTLHGVDTARRKFGCEINKRKSTDEFYSLAPKYEELGSLFSAHKNKVTIAKVDATANDVPDEIQGFPTIKLFPAGAKGSPIDYSGSRTVEDLVEFIRDNGSNKIDVSGAKGDTETETEGVETDGMPQQAPAATKAASDASSAASSKASSASSDASSAATSGASSASSGASSVSSGASSVVASGASSASSAVSSGTGDKVKSAVKDAAAMAYTAVVDSDGDQADHDEL